MAERKGRYSPDEFARRGQEIYDRVIRPSLGPEQAGLFVAVDIESSAFEVDSDDHAAEMRLIERCPDAQVWLLRVGHPAAFRLGGSSLKGRA